MRPDRGQTLANAPIADLLRVLLRQFKRPLAAHGVTLSAADAERLAAAVAERQPEDAQRAALRAGLAAVVAESEGVLARWGLTFEQALDTPMEGMPGWETTAEFLEIANEKSNAELRIAAASALLVALGDAGQAGRIRALIQRDPADTDAQIGQRLLTWASER